MNNTNVVVGLSKQDVEDWLNSGMSYQLVKNGTLGKDIKIVIMEW